MRLESPIAPSCPGCGREDSGFFIDIGSVSPLLKGCARCVGKYGTQALKDEADRLVAIFEAREAEKLVPAHKRGKCWHCDDPVLRDTHTGLYPMLCTECQREINAIKELNGQLAVNLNAEEAIVK